MTFAKPNLFAFPTVEGVVQTARSWFSSPDFPEVRQIPPRRAPVAPPLVPQCEERTRYERLLEKELDRQILSEVEREDTDMLDRVRAALYEG